MKIGVLALQGAFIEHEKTLSRLGVGSVELRQSRDLEESLDGIILCGGESTVQGRLLKDLNMFDPIRERISGGLPVFGTCAGLILLAERIYGGESAHLALMDVTVKRNAYGRQLGSFSCEAEFKGLGKIQQTFIRAPYIESAGEGVEILSVVDGKAVAARQKNMLVTAFHPELTDDTAVHEYFINEFIR